MQSYFAVKHLKHSCLNSGAILLVYCIAVLVLPFRALKIPLRCFAGLTWRPMQKNGTDC